MSNANNTFICFSDIDGTLVHYLGDPAQLQEVPLQLEPMPAAPAQLHQPAELRFTCCATPLQIVGDVLLLPQSSTGKQVSAPEKQPVTNQLNTAATAAEASMVHTSRSAGKRLQEQRAPHCPVQVSSFSSDAAITS